VEAGIRGAVISSLTRRRVTRVLLHLAILGLTTTGLAQAAYAETPQKLGLVLLHGKLGMPLGASYGHASGSPVGAELVSRLGSAGYLVAVPEMCWARPRSFDRTYPECLAEIDAAIAGLRSRGATMIVVGGLSLGGNAALAYGATHSGLAGIIGLSPADDPARKASNPRFGASLAKAQEMVAQGNGDERASFDDTNTGPGGSYPMTIDTTPRIFLSFFGPNSLANIPATAAKLTAPLLWVAGDSDPTQRGGPAYAFDKLPPNPLNRYVVVKASHLQVPDAATPDVLAWLTDLQK